MCISSIFTLGLLLFVCYAIRPMGLTFRSRQFGVSIGLGIAACVNLLQNAWAPALGFYSLANLFVCASGFASIAIWAVYFYLPEIKPRILMLPTTSPYLLWNEISEALGDEPGYVAIGGISPDVFAAAEMEFMFRASAAINQLEASAETEAVERHALSA